MEMVTKVKRRVKRSDSNSRGGTQQNSILQHLNLSPPPEELPSDNATVEGGGRVTRNNKGGRAQRRNNDGQKQQRAPTPPLLAQDESNSIIQSHPRLSRIIEEANYEAFVDPYRGILPYFSLSCNNHTNDDNDGVSNTNNDYARMVDTPNPWKQCEPVLMGECTSWKFQRGEDIDTKFMSSSNKRQKSQSKRQQQEVEIVNVDEESTSVVPVQQLNFNNDNPNDKVRIVQCGCPSIDSWAIEEWEKYQQYLAKKNKKGGKKRKRGKSAVVDVEELTDLSGEDVVMTIEDNDGVVGSNGGKSLADITPTLICGRRKLDGDQCCPCDFNPVSMIDSSSTLFHSCSMRLTHLYFVLQQLVLSSA